MLASGCWFCWLLVLLRLLFAIGSISSFVRFVSCLQMFCLRCFQFFLGFVRRWPLLPLVVGCRFRLSVFGALFVRLLFVLYVAGSAVCFLFVVASEGLTMLVFNNSFCLTTCCCCLLNLMSS